MEYVLKKDVLKILYLLTKEAGNDDLDVYDAMDMVSKLNTIEVQDGIIYGNGCKVPKSFVNNNRPFHSEEYNGYTHVFYDDAR